MWISFRCKLRGEVDQFRVQINTFYLKAPNAQSIAAMAEADAIVQNHKARFATVDDLINDIEKNSR